MQEEKIPRSSFEIPMQLYRACKRLISDNFQEGKKPDSLKQLYILAIEEYLHKVSL